MIQCNSLFSYFMEKRNENLFKLHMFLYLVVCYWCNEKLSEEGEEEEENMQI